MTKTQQSRAELISFYLEECDRSPRLTEWEIGFVDDMSNRDDDLTPKQFDKLKEIYERVTS